MLAALNTPGITKIKCIPSSELSKFANKETLFYDLTIQKKLTNQHS